MQKLIHFTEIQSPNCGNCFWMRGKLPVAPEGIFLHKKYIAKCVKGLIKKCVDENKDVRFKIGGYKEREKIPDYIHWQTYAKSCPFFEDMTD